MSGYYNQGPPQGGHPHNQQGYGYQQPPQGYGPPPFPQQHQQPGGYAPPHAGPPQQGWGPPPPQQQQWGPPPPHHQQHHNQGQYGPPPQQGPPSLPSPGYDPHQQAQGNATPDAHALRKAMKGFGTDEKALINVLSKPDPMQMALLRSTYNSTHHRNLESDIHSETSGYFREGLIALVRGPLVQDCYNVRNAIQGIGTKESMLNDVLLGRSNADMRAIKSMYHQIFQHSLESDVSGDLSLKTETLFKMVMAGTRAEESAPIYPAQVDADVAELHRAMAGFNTDQITVCSILSSRSDGQLRAVAQAFGAKYQTELEKKVVSAFSGHMEQALVLMLRRATDRAMCDAVQLEDTMAGLGTKDNLLVQRVVRVHWAKWSGHMDQVKRAYQHRYHKDLIARIRGDTSGDYERLLVACLQ